MLEACARFIYFNQQKLESGLAWLAASIIKNSYGTFLIYESQHFRQITSQR